MIVFDFGSKTTWFKYTGDSGIGQLSMHPTTAPINDLRTGEILCPICVQSAIQRHNCRSIEDGSNVSGGRMAGCFMKLSLRNLDCFSGLPDADDADATAELPPDDKILAAQQLELSSFNIYKFLMGHMLRRNPCFHVSHIPFVIC
jgi:hypothetical protein